jgi:glucose-1-phosphate thymidylyltransferase
MYTVSLLQDKEADPLKGIILAAGYATRLYPLTVDQPKPLLPVNGKPIIDYITDEMNTLDDLDSIAVISNHRFAAHFEAWARQRKMNHPDEIPLQILDDGTETEETRLGAIGDVQFCISQLGIDDDLLVIAGDNLFTYRLRDAWQHYRQHGEDMVLGSHMPASEDLHRFAIALVDAGGIVTEIEEKPAMPKSDIAVFATYFFRRDTVPCIRQYLKERNSPDAPGHFVVWLYTRTPVRCYMFEGRCYDIGTPQAYEDVMTSFPVSVTGEHFK